MTRTSSLTAVIFVCLLLILGCSNSAKPKVVSAVNNSQQIAQELDSVFKKMWKNTTLSNATAYFKTDVSETFFTINADGIVQNKEQVLADSKRLEMLEILDFKFFDQNIKVYDNVGIINGRIQAFSEGTYVGEVFYTAIFVKQQDTWLYENWQGTWSLDSPPPPSFVSEN